MARREIWSEAQLVSLRRGLLSWYDVNRRKLPWRGDAPPYGAAVLPDGIEPSTAVSAYGTWVSEVMLQQTRVDTVIPFYVRWMARWPAVADLAAASDEDVAAAWAGLGFYRRCRNLHAGAKAVMASPSQSIPSSVSQLKALPGIGDYTAGAIASIAFGSAEALVDGNVVRVLSRLQVIESRWPDLAFVNLPRRPPRCICDAGIIRGPKGCFYYACDMGGGAPASRRGPTRGLQSGEVPHLFVVT